MTHRRVPIVCGIYEAIECCIELFSKGAFTTISFFRLVETSCVVLY